MKTTTISFRLALMAGFAFLAPLSSVPAADTNSSDAVSAQTPAAPAPVVNSTTTAPVKLPYGAEDVLKLSRAQIGEDVILNYVQSSGTIYNLTPKDIVYLHDQGVSEKVLNAMIDQRKRVEMAAQPPVVPAAAPDVANAPMVANAPSVPDAGTAPVAPTYAEAPLTPPASTVYTIPYPAAGYPYYGSYYPYYYGPGYYYGGWYGPSIAIGFGFGRGGFHGGFHGGHSFGGHGGHR